MRLSACINHCFTCYFDGDQTFRTCQGLIDSIIRFDVIRLAPFQALIVAGNWFQTSVGRYNTLVCKNKIRLLYVHWEKLKERGRERVISENRAEHVIYPALLIYNTTYTNMYTVIFSHMK